MSTHAQSTVQQELRPQEFLSTEQLARIAAVDAARSALRSQKGLVGNEAVDATDLLRVATWVFKGSDPWDENTTGSAPTATDGDDQDPGAEPSTASGS